MEPQWLEQFAVVIRCLYTVVWDVEDKKEEIVEQLLKNRTIKGPNARNWPSHRETEAHALELRKRNIVEKIRTL